MGQADVWKLLKMHKSSKGFVKRPWLTVREIYVRLKGRRYSSEIGSVTNSVKRLREAGMIKCRETAWKLKNTRKIYHYQAK